MEVARSMQGLPTCARSRRGGARSYALLLLALVLVALASVLLLSAPRAGEESTWVVRAADHVCGLDDARMLSDPARVDYELLLRATPEWREMESRGIDPESARGIQLRARAADRVRAAAELERQSQGRCSVWKQIRHVDGRAIPDMTAAVLRRIVESEDSAPTAAARR